MRLNKKCKSSISDKRLLLTICLGLYVSALYTVYYLSNKLTLNPHCSLPVRPFAYTDRKSSVDHVETALELAWQKARATTSFNVALALIGQVFEPAKFCFKAGFSGFGTCVMESFARFHCILIP